MLVNQSEQISNESPASLSLFKSFNKFVHNILLGKEFIKNSCLNELFSKLFLFIWVENLEIFTPWPLHHGSMSIELAPNIRTVNMMS